MKHTIYSFLLIFAIAAFPASLNAAGLINQSNNVFKFQQRLANNGNVNAQYKLAYMYETGDGTKASFDKALHWYDRAAKSGLKKADQRNTYLMVKELGYDKKLHAGWLNAVKGEATNREADAMLLLGQLYRQGIGVRKNLNKSLSLLNQVSILGDADVDNEIESIYVEIDAAKARRTVAKKKKAKVIASKPATKAKVKVAKKKAPKKVTTATVAKKLTEKERIQAEKVRRYEQAMLKLKLEQQLIDEQQASVSGDAVAAIDDEF